MIVMYLEVLGMTGKRQLVQCAWNFMNDSLRSDVFVRFHPESIACACIYLAARQCQVPLPNNPPWYWLFAVGEDEIQQICLSILKLYARPKPNQGQLEKVVDELKRKRQAAKSKARDLVSDLDTPNSSSCKNSPKIISPNPSVLSQALKKGLEDGRDAGSDKSDRSSSHWGASKKTSRHSEDSDRSGASNKSESRMSSSHSSYLSRHSRSSGSESPAARKRRRSPSIEKNQMVDTFNHNKHKRKYRSPSRSASRSPVHYKSSKKMRRDNDYYQEKEYRDRGYYKEKVRDYYKSKSDKDRGYYSKSNKDRDYYSKSDKNRDYYSKSDKNRDYYSKSDKDRDYYSKSDKDRDYYSKSDKDRDYYSKSNKDRLL